MGAAAGQILLGSALGLGAAALLGKNQQNQSNSASSYNPIEYQPSETAVSAQTPIDVAQTETGATNNAQMEAERQKELQAAALRQQQNSGILTSGLGAAGVATTRKKGLLGG